MKLLFDIAPFDSADSTEQASPHFMRSVSSAAGTRPPCRDMLASPGTFAFCHEDGFVVVRAAADEAEILTLAVRPGARGKGLGRALLQAAIDKARALGAATVFLEVGADNPACAGALCRTWVSPRWARAKPIMTAGTQLVLQASAAPPISPNLMAISQRSIP